MFRIAHKQMNAQHCFRYGGTIYAFLFSADIINNLLVATMIKGIKGALGYLGLFVFVSMWGIVALIATL